jgi:mono/diheme cytochrome c family protein
LPRTDVQRVFLVFEPPRESGVPGERVQLAPAGAPGLWAASGAHTPVVGDWQLEVVVRRRGALDESASFPLVVSPAVAPASMPPPDSGIGVPGPLIGLWILLPGGWAGWIPTLGLLCLAAALFRLPARPATTALRVVVLLLALAAGMTTGSRDLVAAANAPPPAAVAQVNPVEAAPASLDRGRSLYQANCSTCHGPDGSGGGPAAAAASVHLRPLADVVPAMTDGALAHRIAVGTYGTGMPPFAATLSEQDRWDLVNYLRSAMR